MGGARAKVMTGRRGVRIERTRDCA